MADSFTLKLDWSEKRLKRLDHDSSAWVERESQRIIDEPDPTPLSVQLSFGVGHHRRFRVLDVESVPDDFGLLFGDCVHNLRSSLDHLAMALAMANAARQGVAMTDREIAGSEFPIFFDRPMTLGEETKKIGRMDATARQIIADTLQPHLRGAQYRDDPLWRIHEFDRIDKHRRLTLCAASNLATDPTGTTMPAVGFILKEKPTYRLLHYRSTPMMVVERGAVLLNYTAVYPDDPSRKVKMQPNMPLQIAFGKGETLEFEPLVPTLKALCEFVRNTVFAQLTKFL